MALKRLPYVSRAKIWIQRRDVMARAEWKNENERCDAKRVSRAKKWNECRDAERVNRAKNDWNRMPWHWTREPGEKWNERRDA